MAPRIRVLHVITDLALGGAETMLLKLVRRSHPDRFAHAVVSLHSEGTMVPRFREARIEVHSLGMSTSRPPVAPLVALRSRLRDFDPDVIQGWMYHGNLAGLVGRWLAASRAALAWNIRQTLYDLGNEKRMTAAVIRAGAMLSRRPAAIVYNSATSAGQHEQLGYEPRSRRLIPNGFDCDAFAPDAQVRARMRAALGFRETDVVVALVTRFHPMKGHRTFIAAAAQVAQAHPEARFLIVGRGVGSPDAGVIDALERAGLKDRAIVLEERHDIAELYNATDIACSSSAWGEGFSNAIGEAMACGVPCVVTDRGDSAAIVADTGIAVAASDPAAMASAIGALVAAGSEGRRTLGEAARRRVQERYSLDAVVAQYESLYEALAKDGALLRRLPTQAPIEDR
jgi:glycosyltransferase involved in cell wall biosynthesis